MDGSWAWIVAVIAAVIGYLVGSSRSKRVIAVAKHNLKIDVTKDGGGYSSVTDIKRKHVKRWDVVEWKVKDDGPHELPSGSHVFLRFASGSAVFPAEPSDLGTRRIFALIDPLKPNNEYHYKVYYRHDGNEHLLEDPVLIIEGDRHVVDA